jgi:branched-chain amino acid transport system ATP-binding protein
MTAPVLAVDNLSTGYVRAPVLRDVTIHVGDEIVALLGANGAGKTTALRAISGTLRTWSGSIQIDGDDLGRRSPWSRVARGVAHVPEGRHVLGAMTVQENLDVAALVGRRRRSRIGRDDVYSMFPRLAERRHQPSGSMSGGEQQMLVIGRALVTDPRVLLVDEMSAGLAPVTARSLVESLAVVRRELGIAMLLVEQSPRLIEDVVDRVYLLEQGRVTASGTLDAVGGIDGLADAYLGGVASSTSASVPASTDRMRSRREAQPVLTYKRER